MKDIPPDFPSFFPQGPPGLAVPGDPGPKGDPGDQVSRCEGGHRDKKWYLEAVTKSCSPPHHFRVPLASLADQDPQ